jgi:quercetin dioxygenase-like cupin family protein
MADERKSEWTAGHPVSGIANLNVPEEIARLKSGAQWAAGDRAAEALAKNSELSVTLIVLKQGAALKEHSARGTAAVAVVSGAIRLNGTIFGAGTIAVIDHEVPHAVEAIEESAFILTAVLK